MIKSNFFKGLLISAIAASSIYAADVSLVLESSNDKAPMWAQKSGVSDFKMVTFPARVNLSEFSSIASFQVVNATPLDGSGTYPKDSYKATIEAGVVTSIIQISDDSDVTTTVKELMFADGTKLKGNNPYYMGGTSEEINVKLVFKTGTLATFDLTADTDSDGILNGADYCPYTAGVEGIILDDDSANSKTRGLRAISLLEVDGNGIPSIPTASDTTVTSSGTDLVVNLVMDGANSVFVAKYGASLDAITESGTFDGMAVTVPSTAKYIQIISDGGTVTFELSGTADDATVEPTATPDVVVEPTATPDVVVEPTPDVVGSTTSVALNGCPAISVSGSTPTEPTPEVTPEVTPESTPEVTPEATPEVTPEATTVTLLEVDGNGIPSIPAAGDTTVTSSGTDLVISLVMDGANSVFVAKYGASLDAITESATFEGMAVTVPSTAKYVQIISDGGTVTFEVN